MTEITKTGITFDLITSIVEHANALVQSSGATSASNNPIVRDRRARFRATTQGGVNTQDPRPTFGPQADTGDTPHYTLALNNTTDLNTLGITAQEGQVPANLIDTVSPVGFKITPAAIVDIMMLYGHRMTRARLANFTIRGLAGPAMTSAVAVFADTSQYRMNPASFLTAVTAAPNPLIALAPGMPANLASLNTLRDRINQVITTHSSSAVSVTCCHSSCHANCHSNRNRR